MGEGRLPAGRAAGARLACAVGEVTAQHGRSPVTLVGMVPWKRDKDRGAHVPLHACKICELCSTVAVSFGDD